MNKFKKGDVVIRIPGFYYAPNISDWSAIIMDVPCDDRSEIYKVVFRGECVFWRASYFRKATKLEKALK